jgi:putative intracellular protease/amidase
LILRIVSLLFFKVMTIIKESGINVLLLVAHGTEEMEAVITVDILRRGQLQVHVVSVETTHEVVCSRSVKLVADYLLSDLKHFDQYNALIIPGGNKGSETLAANPRVQDLVKEFEHTGRLVALICAGKMEKSPKVNRRNHIIRLYINRSSSLGI